MNKGRKKQSLRRITLLFICLLVVGYLFTGTDLFAREEQEAEYNESLDSETFTEHPIQLAGFDELPTIVDEERLVEDLDEPIQKFLFENKTFQTTINQPVLLQFSSTLPADEVLIRVPESGQIATEYLTNGEVVKHSHGEYWYYQTTTEQTQFNLPVLFDSAGKYFLTIDHDADNFYLEVNEPLYKVPDNDAEMAETDKLIDEELEIPNSIDQDSRDQLVVAEESDLLISQELMDKEDERVLEETRDPQNRSVSTVGNWSQFRSAWNSSSTTSIQMSADIDQGLLSLNTRSRDITINFLGSNSSLFLDDGDALVLSGSANLNLANGSATVRTGNLYGSIVHNGNGRVRVSDYALIARFQTSTFAQVSAQNITIQSGGVIQSNINLRNNGTLEINDAGGRRTGISILGGNPIVVNSNANIYINGDRLAIGGSFSSDRQGWNSANIHLRGLHGREIVSAVTDPDDFSHRYSSLGLSETTFIMINASASDVNIPLPTYELSLQASPSQGGNPTAQALTIQQGDTTTISANPNAGYRFIRWENVSGNGSIANPTSTTTTFTMGSSDATVRAVYEATPANNLQLHLVAIPVEGGRPTAGMYSMLPGEGTMLSANPNAGYRFVRWDMVSGVGSSFIMSFTSPNTGLIMGNVDTTLHAIYEKEQLEEEKHPGEVHVYHVDEEGNELAETVILTGNAGEEYQTIPAEIKNYQLKRAPENAAGVFSDEIISVVYVYEIEKVIPVDPLDPEVEINPENKPELPENQGLLSIDFASKFQFGRQIISAQDQQYYAEPQRLMNDDGTVNENEERPNYVQISDRRPEDDREGWQLSVTQNTPFVGTDEQELTGARLSLMNQQLATAQDSIAPEIQQTNPLSLVPGSRRILLMAQGDEGTGTWIYRFGDEQSAGSSVVLDVPRGATPEATTYSTTLTWELSAVPDNYN